MFATHGPFYKYSIHEKFVDMDYHWKRKLMTDGNLFTQLLEVKYLYIQRVGFT